MTGMLECISVGIISLLFIKIYALFCKNKNEIRVNLKTKQDGKCLGSLNLHVDIICDITNNFGKYYAKEAIKKKYIIGIIPVYKTYNKEYEDINRFNEFMAELFKFLNMRNGKLILASEDNCIVNFLHTELKSEEEKEEREDKVEAENYYDDNILLGSCIIINEKVSVVVCVIKYEKEIEKQLHFFLRNKKKGMFVIVNNIFLNNNIKKDDKRFKNMEILEKKCSLIQQGDSDINNFLSFFDFFNVKKEYLNDIYSIIQINMKNFTYFYKLLGNYVTAETYLNGYMYGNLVDTKIYNSLMDIYYDVISEAIKKDNKKIHMKKFYTFYGQKCDYRKIVKFTLMRLENNILFYIYDIYFYIYYQLILYFS
ncbi:hypothetical protein MKS88_002820 [Plasmodium brasilianum]|uniref:Uncharacterized protein n=2 Tax=Plasmodium (Plasmodium) TaxID=418103 RepID=A0A1A8W2W7_PLAMA|nr:conserved Plasmodium protein, unknown function [Plasmodium malariae]KAI4838343.1 hypothetical protein MKS88_002820 [Plasmodium brasilianum]SBS85500.1 conserved Plasmodium protein, unknown function [Plasmodium malariae]SCN12742.1 conserved Plasmodium protein, unknown function [Plasmodium malariae]